jgi:hypothetical protein
MAGASESEDESEGDNEMAQYAAPAAMCSRPSVLTQVYCIIETMIKMQ